MSNEILAKLTELHELIDKSDVSEKECLIIGDHSNETNMIGTEDSYLNLINSIAKLILISRDVIKEYGEYNVDQDGLSSSEIKKAINEYSDFWIVDMSLQNEQKFDVTLKRQYENWVESHKKQS